ncbi:MAG: DUF5071 domain-containing protein [Pseudobdellovibrionaceae bacterium]|nr:DUF5071 domain-containing protein [Pseudobdellovibrionaceae bacterium]
MSQDTKKLIASLDANHDQGTQTGAMAQLLAMQDHLDLTQLCQKGPKALWQNEALVLQKIGFPRLNAVLPELLVWVQDMNWPGAWTIMRLLQSAPSDPFQAAWASAMKMARETDDEEWWNHLNLAQGIQRQDPEALIQLRD